MKTGVNKRAVIAIAITTTGLLAIGSPALAADGDDRVTTTISDWRGLDTGMVVLSSDEPNLFTVPAAGTSGPIEYETEAGDSFCLLTEQSGPYRSLSWGIPSEVNPCQDITTVVKPDTGETGFTATDGEYLGRYLGDFSEGGVVDWAQDAFYAIDVPGLPAPAPEPEPEPADDAETTLAEEPVTISILSNDGDTTGWNVSPGTSPAQGSVTYNTDGTATYTPNTGFTGDDTFVYNITTADGATATATVTITVTPIIEVPEPKPVDDAETTPAEEPVTVAILSNDGDATGWVTESDILPAHGSVTYNADGTATYTPNTGFTGDDTFEYRVTTADRMTATATVIITVTPLVEAPEPVATGEAVAEPQGETRLAATGSEFATPLLGLAGLLMAAGIALAVVARRRSAQRQ